MSTSYTAYAVIGVVVSKAHLYRVEVHHHSEKSGHAVPEGALFCPVCGKEAYYRTMEPLFDEIKWCVGPFGLISSYEDDRVALGYNATEPGYYYHEKDKEWRSMPLPDINELKDRLRFYLEPLGLWDESTFGLHAILHIS